MSDKIAGLPAHLRTTAHDISRSSDLGDPDIPSLTALEVFRAQQLALEGPAGFRARFGPFAERNLRHLAKFYGLETPPTDTKPGRPVDAELEEIALAAVLRTGMPESMALTRQNLDTQGQLDDNRRYTDYVLGVARAKVNIATERGSPLVGRCRFEHYRALARFAEPVYHSFADDLEAPRLHTVATDLDQWILESDRGGAVGRLVEDLVALQHSFHEAVEGGATDEQDVNALRIQTTRALEEIRDNVVSPARRDAETYEEKMEVVLMVNLLNDFALHMGTVQIHVRAADRQTRVLTPLDLKVLDEGGLLAL